MTQAPQIQRVAVALFDGFTVLDAYGPIQAFAACRLTTPDGKRQPFFEIFTVGTRPGPARSAEGPVTQVEHAFADAPRWDILVVPGGVGTRALVKDDAFLGQLARASERSAITTTICTGAALLARTGRLDGRPATTNKIAWDWVLEQGPRVRWQRRARWVDDGDILTSSGVSAGTDMALALVGRLHGRDMAVTAARNMEHIWNEDPANDPFA